MNLDAALDAIHGERVRKGPRCVVGAILDQLPDDTRAKVVHVLTVPNRSGQLVSTATIATVLTDAGYPVRAASVVRHRRRLLGRQNGCACDVE